MPSLSPELRSRFRRLALINVLSNLTVPLAGLADTAMLGRLPEATELAGVALASLLFDLLYFGLGFLRMGTTGPVAQAHGRGDAPFQTLLFWRAALLAMGFGVWIVVLRAPLSQLTFALLSGSPAVEAAGANYLDARIWGAPATLMNLVLLGWLLGRSQSGRALAVTAVQNLVNIALNAVFILGLGLGATGAGWATAAGQYSGLLIGLALVIPQLEVSSLSWKEVLNPQQVREMLGLNRDIFLRTLCLLAAFTAFTDFSARFGTSTLAANAVLLRVLTLGSYWIDGLAYATETLVGRLHGGAQSVLLRPLLGWVSRLAIASALVVALPTALAPRQLLFWLVSDPEARFILEGYSLWLIPVLGFGSVAYVLDGFFLGLSAGRLLRNSMLASLLAFLAPALLALYLGRPALLWLALTFLMLARAATLLRAVPR